MSKENFTCAERSTKKEWKILLFFVLVFAAVFWLPVESLRFKEGVFEGFAMLKDYAREHVLLCLIPAFFIAGAVTVFIRKDSIVKYFGAKAKKWKAYSVASVSGSVLSVCSCTILPLFAGIYTRGAGLGPATAFLYSGPAVNVMAIILTAKVLGIKLGLARGLGAVMFAIVIGLLMHLLFNKEEKSRSENNDFSSGEESQTDRPMWKNILFFASMIGFLVAVNLSAPGMTKWIFSGILLAAIFWMIARWLAKPELKEWMDSTWIFAKQIMPLLFAGILVAGMLLGRPGHEALIPGRWIASLVGGNSLVSNLFASVSGALMYFCTLIEVPILEGLIGAGMGQGPALALLLAGPALSLPNMLVIRSIIGTKKTMTYIALVVVMSTLAGFIYGNIFG